MLDPRVDIMHGLPGGQQAIVKAIDHAHRQNNQAVFVRLNRASEHIGHILDHGGLFHDIRSDNIDFNVGHQFLLFCQSADDKRYVAINRLDCL